VVVGGAWQVGIDKKLYTWNSLPLGTEHKGVHGGITALCQKDWCENSVRENLGSNMEKNYIQSRSSWVMARRKPEA